VDSQEGAGSIAELQSLIETPLTAEGVGDKRNKEENELERRRQAFAVLQFSFIIPSPMFSW
jgi:hypothetical protein